MLYKKMVKIALLSAGMLALAACSTTGDNDGANGAGGAGGANGAASSGVGQMSSFGGPGNANAMKVANQSYYFDFNQNDVHDSDQPSIKVQANYLAAHPNAKVRLEGNTDPRGSREYNIALGNRRAMAVAAVLEMDGVAKNQITTVSYGDEKPVSTGTDENSYSQDRRVDLLYLTPIK